MKKLQSTDLVIYDIVNDSVKRFSLHGSIVIYGNYDEALKDKRGDEIVILCTELPRRWQYELIKQINN